tara:strand:+ start:958 stop:1278 length:321 start_codon:yes stop_codon:yes gene_type:complete
MANKETKFTEEELKSLNELSQGYQNIQSSFGQMKVQRILIDQQIESLEEAEIKLETDYTDIQKKERELVKELNEKYGPGSLDPQTGVFTPQSQPEAAPEEIESEES